MRNLLLKKLPFVLLGIALGVGFSVSAKAGYFGGGMWVDDRTNNWGIGTISEFYKFAVNGPTYFSDVTVGNVKNCNGSLALETNHDGKIQCGTDAGETKTGGYILNVQALSSSPVDGKIVYFGQSPKAPSTVAGKNKIYIMKPGVIKAANITAYSTKGGSGEPWSLYISVNGEKDALIKTISLYTTERRFYTEDLSIPVVAGDFIEIRGLQPIWSINPTGVTYGGYLVIE